MPSILVIDQPTVMFESSNVIHLRFDEFMDWVIEHYDYETLRRLIDEASISDFNDFIDSDFGKQILEQLPRFSDRPWDFKDIRYVYASNSQLHHNPFIWILIKFEIEYNFFFEDTDKLEVNNAA